MFDSSAITWISGGSIGFRLPLAPQCMEFPATSPVGRQSFKWALKSLYVSKVRCPLLARILVGLHDCSAQLLVSWSFTAQEPFIKGEQADSTVSVPVSHLLSLYFLRLLRVGYLAIASICCLLVWPAIMQAVPFMVCGWPSLCCSLHILYRC